MYIPPRGPWSEEHEADYQKLLAEIGRMARQQREDPNFAEKLRNDPAELANWNGVLARSRPIGSRGCARTCGCGSRTIRSVIRS